LGKAKTIPEANSLLKSLYSLPETQKYIFASVQPKKNYKLWIIAYSFTHILAVTNPK